MYKPNFCAECGERVLRERWRAWTSRRFCPACEKRFRKVWIAPLLAAFALACAGFSVGRLMRPGAPPLIIERGALPLPALLTKNGAKANDATGNDAETADDASRDDATTGDATSDANSPARASSDAGPQAISASVVDAPTDPNEIVSICGARTKKGTPCQRRVRGTGRCWQHRGMPAMLPPEKLIVHDKN
ncbi:MAG: hypothetical protein QOE33_242 [Acidobacteriota bacterium]|nr:hypothetical protein [Acidobacteriota bacterium]